VKKQESKWWKSEDGLSVFKKRMKRLLADLFLIGVCLIAVLLLAVSGHFLTWAMSEIFSAFGIPH